MLNNVNPHAPVTYIHTNIGNFKFSHGSYEYDSNFRKKVEEAERLKKEAEELEERLKKNRAESEALLARVVSLYDQETIPTVEKELERVPGGVTNYYGDCLQFVKYYRFNNGCMNRLAPPPIQTPLRSLESTWEPGIIYHDINYEEWKSMDDVPTYRGKFECRNGMWRQTTKSKEARRFDPVIWNYVRDQKSTHYFYIGNHANDFHEMDVDLHVDTVDVPKTIPKIADLKPGEVITTEIALNDPNCPFVLSTLSFISVWTRIPFGYVCFMYGISIIWWCIAMINEFLCLISILSHPGRRDWFMNNPTLYVRHRIRYNFGGFIYIITSPFVFFYNCVEAAYRAGQFMMMYLRFSETVHNVTTAVTDKLTLARTKIEEVFTTWSTFNLLNFFTHEYTAEDKVFLTELKAALHVMYHIYQNNRTAAFEHASYFLILRVELVKRFLSNQALWTTLGVARRHQGAYENNPDPVHHNDVEVHVFTVDQFASQFASMYSLAGMSDKDIQRSINQFRYIDARKNMFANNLEFLKTTASWIGRTCYDIDPFAPDHLSFVNDMCDIIFEAKKYITMDEYSLQQRENIAAIIALGKKYDEMSVDPKRGSVTNQLNGVFNSLNVALTERVREAIAKQRGAHARVVPLMALFIGPAGVGKTRACHVLRQQIHVLEHDARTPGFMRPVYVETDYYTSPANSDYEDNYTNQNFYGFDDIWKSVELADKKRDSLKIIDMVNSSIMPCNMANLHQKGRVFFDSPYIQASTNMFSDLIKPPDYFKDLEFKVGVEHSEAISRRMHFVLYNDKPAERDMSKVKFRIVHCVLDPTLVNKEFSITELALIMFEHKNILRRQKDSDVYTADQIREQLREARESLVNRDTENGDTIRRMRIIEKERQRSEKALADDDIEAKNRIDMRSYGLSEENQSVKNYISTLIQDDNVHIADPDAWKYAQDRQYSCNNSGVTRAQFDHSERLIEMCSNDPSKDLRRPKTREERWKVLQTVMDRAEEQGLISSDPPPYDLLTGEPNEVEQKPPPWNPFKSVVNVFTGKKDDNHEDDVEMHVHSHDDKPAPTVATVAAKIVTLQIHDWCDTPNAKYYMILLALLTSSVFLISVYMFFQQFREVQVEQEEEEEIVHGEADETNVELNTYRRDGKKATKKRKKKADVSYVPIRNIHLPDVETHSDVTNYYAALTKAKKCVVIFQAISDNRDGTTRYESCTGFHVKGGYFATCAHFMYPNAAKISAGESVRFKIRTHEGASDFKLPEDLYYFEKMDIVYFKVPLKMSSMLEGYKYLRTIEDIEELETGTTVNMMAYNTAQDVIEPVKLSLSVPHTFSYSIENKFPVNVEWTISYQQKCYTGQSGAPVFYASRQGSPVLVAMHLCGNKTGPPIGMAMVITRELFDSVETIETHSHVSEGGEFPLQISQVVPFHLGAPITRYNKMRPTQLHGVFGDPIYIPTIMKADEKRGIPDPYITAVKKMHQEPTPPISLTEDIMDWLMYQFDGGEKRLYTIDEAIGGIPGVTNAICIATSAGYPYCLSHTRGKTAQLYLEDGVIKGTQEFKGIVARYNEKLQNGEPIDCKFKDAMKAETRHFLKVAAGKTRLFATVPLHVLVLFRIYFQDMFTWLKQFCVTTGMSVGIDPHSTQWTELYHRFDGMESIVAGDFENWDGMLPAFVVEFVCEFINRWYNDGPVNAQIRRLLCRCLTHQTRIGGCNIYNTVDGMPSGVYGTAEINTLCHMVIIYHVFVHKLQIPISATTFALYGDDNLIGVKRPNITCATLAPIFKSEFGMTYTHFSKEAPLDTVNNIHDVTFIGRSFVPNTGDPIIRAPLELRTIQEIPYYYKDGTGDMVCIRSMIDAFYSELAHHSYETYTKIGSEFVFNVENDPLFEDLDQYIKDYVRKARKPYHMFQQDRYFSDVRVAHEITAPFVVIPEHYGIIDFELHSHISSFDQARQTIDVTNTRNDDQNARAVNMPDSTIDIQLGAMHNVNAVDATVVNQEIIQAPHQVENFESFEFDSVCAREYVVFTGPWTTAQVSGATIFTANIPDILLNLAQFDYFRNNYRFFSAGIRFTIQLSTNPFVYGTLLGFFVPGNEVTLDTGVVRQTGYSHVIASASSGETVVFDIPFICKSRMIDFTNYSQNEGGFFIIRVLNQLLSAQADTPTCSIVVSAQFINPHFFMPITPNSAVVDFELHSHKGPTKVNHEATRKGKQGISTAFDDAATIAGVLENVPGISPYASLINGSAKIASVTTKMMGLNKPQSLESTTIIKVNPYANFNYVHGTDNGVGMGMFAENSISTAPEVGGISCDEMTFSYMTSIPMIASQHTIMSTVGVHTLVDTMQNNDNVYCDQVSRFFLYYSTTIKYCFHFVASQYHNIRGVIWLQPSGTGTATNYTNCYHTYVEIQGDTLITKAFPYITQRFMQANGSGSEGRIFFTVLSWSQPDSALVRPIMLNVWKAFDNFQPAGYIDRCIELTSAVVDVELHSAIGHSNMREVFSKPFEFIHPSMKNYEQTGFVCGEKVVSLREVLHKVHPYYQTSAVTADPRRTFNYAPYQIKVGGVTRKFYFGIEAWAQFFMFWRGSIRLKFLPYRGDSPYNNLVIQSNNGTGPIIHAFSTSMENNPVLEATVPYFYDTVFKSTRELALPDVLTYGVATYTTKFHYVMKASGDDFSLMNLAPLPANAVVSIPPIGDTGGTGVIGMQSFFA